MAEAVTYNAKMKASCNGFPVIAYTKKKTCIATENSNAFLSSVYMSHATLDALRVIQRLLTTTDANAKNPKTPFSHNTAKYALCAI